MSVSLEAYNAYAQYSIYLFEGNSFAINGGRANYYKIIFSTIKIKRK